MRLVLASAAALVGAAINGSVLAQQADEAQRGAPATAAAAASPADTDTRAAASDDKPVELGTVLIVGKRAERTSKGATGLQMSVLETPQSISTIDRQQIDNFAAYSLNDALKLATGINVEEWETNRTNYLARGFEIKSTQIDGVGMPNDWGIVTGAMDSFGYEKLEVIRGANGLLTGVGNAAGTLNYVRKRPTNAREGSIRMSLGSFDFRRIEADYSTPLTADGRWAGRVVLAGEDKGSWLRDKRDDRSYGYAVIDGQIGANSTLTFGYSQQQANTEGNLWGALVLSNSDSTQAEFPRSASTALDWTFWDTKTQTAFAEYTYAIAPDWNTKLSYNYRAMDDDGYLFYVYTLTGLDPDTATGLYGYPGSFPSQSDAHLLDLNVDGHFALFGREHQLLLGLARSRSHGDMQWRPVPADDPNFGALPAFPYPGDSFPLPAFGDATFYSTDEQTLTRAYGASQLGVTDTVKLVLGFNWARYNRKGRSIYSDPYDQTESELAPYAGLTWQWTPNLLGYASYSDIYQPQDQTDADGRFLDPSKGVNYEVGVKSDWLKRRLIATLAWFTAEQNNLATFAGLNGAGQYYYKGLDVTSKGVEFELTGKPHALVDVVLGVTALQLHGDDGGQIYNWVPRRTVNVQAITRVPGLTALTLGIGGRWQGSISTLDENTGVTIRQGDYALINAFARYALGHGISVQVNGNNLSNEKYLTSLYQVGFYGAPRNVMAGLQWSF